MKFQCIQYLKLEEAVVLNICYQWVFVGTAAVSMALYMFMFLVMVVGVYQKMKKRQRTLSQMSISAQKRFEVGTLDD